MHQHYLQSQINCIPHFPALRSDPTAVSGASRRKQMVGLNWSLLFGPLHEKLTGAGLAGLGKATRGGEVFRAVS
jgi:hypothetical protein